MYGRLMYLLYEYIKIYDKTSYTILSLTCVKLKKYIKLDDKTILKENINCILRNIRVTWYCIINDIIIKGNIFTDKIQLCMVSLDGRVNTSIGTFKGKARNNIPIGRWKNTDSIGYIDFDEKYYINSLGQMYYNIYKLKPLISKN